MSHDALADTTIPEAHLERQQEPKAAEPVPNWRELLEPVRPSFDADVLALSDEQRDGLFGLVRTVRERYEFTSAANPEWNPEWDNRPESDYYRTITYDVNGTRVSHVWRPGCGLSAPKKMILLGLAKNSAPE